MTDGKKAELAEMRAHGLKIRGAVEKLVAGLRRDDTGQS